MNAWLSADATPAQITRALTANLTPAPVPIPPSHFLAPRLATLLPPPLPTTPRATEPKPAHPAQLINCDGCDRASASMTPGPAVPTAGPHTRPGRLDQAFRRTPLAHH